jgi:hypothetical protein
VHFIGIALKKWRGFEVEKSIFKQFLKSGDNQLMDKSFILKEFIKNFVVKDRRDRVEFQLSNPRKRNQFIQKLNHSYAEVLDMRKLKTLPNTRDDFEYIKNELGIQDQDHCYMTSNYDDIDDCFLEFETAFDKKLRTRLCNLNDQYSGG